MARRIFNTENLCELLDTVESISDQADGFHQMSATAAAQLEDYAAQTFPADRAEELVEPLHVLSDLVEAATANTPDDDLDLSETLVYKVASGSVQRVLTPRLVLGDGDTATFSLGSVKVPVIQQKQKLVIGRLVAENAALEYECETRDLPKGDKIYTHKIAFTDSESGDLFLVDLFVAQGIENDAVKPHLKSGEPLHEILAKSGSGAGGSVSLANYLSQEQIPFKSKVVKIHVWDTESKFSPDGKAYAVTLEDGTTVWLRGKAEVWMRKNASTAAKILDDGEEILLRVTSMKVGDNGRVSMTTGITLPKSNTFIPSIAGGEDKPKKALTATKAEAPASAAPAAVEADQDDESAAPAEPKVAVKLDPFAKAKVRAAATA
jgi:hypothetical protein